MRHSRGEFLQGRTGVESCLLCPKGTRCRGYVLHVLSLKLIAALETATDARAAGEALSREDRLLFAESGEAARRTCWTKAFVLTVAQRIAELVAAGHAGEQLRYAIEGLFAVLDGLYARLPNGIVIELNDLALDVYNQTCANLEAVEGEHFVPANIVAQAYAAFLQRKTETAG
jgi:hypothetical protein